MTNDGHFHDVVADLRAPTRDLRRADPGTWAGFGDLHEHAVADGVLPARVKGMMALVGAVVNHRDGCVAHHAAGAARAGATEGEVAEDPGVTLLMGDGPASVWAPRALAAFQEIAAPSGGET